MENEQFAPYQFLDAASLNAISSAVSGNIDSLATAFTGPGLIRPDLLVLASSGLSVTATMPSPFAALFGNGVLAFANGSIPGQTSDSATISLASLVPTSGAAVTAYVSLTLSSVNEGPFQVTGPPPGHPDYNPNFAAYTAYAQNWDSVTLSTSLTAPNGTTSLFLCSTTLASGQSSLGALVTRFQTLATPLPTQNFVNVVTNKALAPTDAGILQRLTAAVYLTLPDVSVASRIFPFACRSAGCFIQASTSGELIYGFGGEQSTIVQPLNGQAGAFVSDGLSWQTMFLSDSNSANPIQGSQRALVITNYAAAPTIARQINADYVILQDFIGNSRSASMVSTIYSTANVAQAGGIFQGSLTPASWLYEYVIYNPTTNSVSCGADVSNLAPTLPAGYTFFALVGAIYVDGSGNLVRTVKRGRSNQYAVATGSNTPNPPLITEGIQGDPNIPTYVATSITAVVPTAVAASIKILLTIAGGSTAIVAPNNAWAALGAGIDGVGGTAPSDTSGLNITAEFVLESSDLYYAASAETNGLYCLGWEDNFG